jgi:hypothetical protein
MCSKGRRCCASLLDLDTIRFSHPKLRGPTLGPFASSHPILPSPLCILYVSSPKLKSSSPISNACRIGSANGIGGTITGIVCHRTPGVVQTGYYCLGSLFSLTFAPRLFPFCLVRLSLCIILSTTYPLSFTRCRIRDEPWSTCPVHSSGTKSDALIQGGTIQSKRAIDSYVTMFSSPLNGKFLHV